MKTKEFLEVAPKLMQTGLISVSKKGSHRLLGVNCIGETENQKQCVDWLLISN